MTSDLVIPPDLGGRPSGRGRGTGSTRFGPLDSTEWINYQVQSWNRLLYIPRFIYFFFLIFIGISVKRRTWCNHRDREQGLKLVILEFVSHIFVSTVLDNGLVQNFKVIYRLLIPPFYAISVFVFISLLAWYKNINVPHIFKKSFCLSLLICIMQCYYLFVCLLFFRFVSLFLSCCLSL